MTAREVIIKELREQNYGEPIENVILSALEYYCENHNNGTLSESTAYILAQKIRDSENTKDINSN